MYPIVYVCNNCRTEFPDKVNFCPTCGMRMRYEGDPDYQGGIALARQETQLAQGPPVAYESGPTQKVVLIILSLVALIMAISCPALIPAMILGALIYLGIRALGAGKGFWAGFWNVLKGLYFFVKWTAIIALCIAGIFTLNPLVAIPVILVVLACIKYLNDEKKE